MEPSSAPSPLSFRQRLLLVLLGGGSFGTGVLAVFAAENDIGAAVLLIFGGILLVLAVLGSRIESLEYGGAKLRLRAAAAEKLALAEELEQRGDSREADRLRLEADALLDVAGPIAADYRTVRGTMAAGYERTNAMEQIVERAKVVAAEQSFSPKEVLRWLQEDSDDAERITALAMMQANRQLRNFEAVLAAIQRPRSPFEQYHALRLAADMITDLDTEQRQQLTEIIASQRKLPRFQRDTDRWLLSELIVRRL